MGIITLLVRLMPTSEILSLNFQALAYGDNLLHLHSSQKNLCFCNKNSLLLRSIFKKLFVFQNCDCVVPMSILINFKTVVNFVVSPLVFITIFYTLITPSSPSSQKRKPESFLKKAQKDTYSYSKCLCKKFIFYFRITILINILQNCFIQIMQSYISFYIKIFTDSISFK